MNESELKVVKRYAMKQINLITAILLIHSFPAQKIINLIKI